MAPRKIIVITGPTATGKSAAALELAGRVGGEIISADSMQIYRKLDIGTAKPTCEELERIPHHLINILDIEESYSAGRFREEASEAIEEISSRNGVPIVAGGTPLYIKVLLEGIVELPKRDEKLRRELISLWEEGGGKGLWEELEKVDPVLASRLHPNDRTRIIRGVEIFRLTGKPLSRFQEEHSFREKSLDAKVFGMEVQRGELYERINARVTKMLAAGWVEEVRGVLREGYSPDISPLQAIGYRELCRYLEKGGDLEGVADEIRQSTRRFAKRQMTWLRKMDIEWLPPDDVDRLVWEGRKFLQTG